MNTPITMAEVAREIGVSTSTVSRALRNDPRISVERRERIKDVAQALGYRPNPLVSALMSSRKSHFDKAATNTIALVTDYGGSTHWRVKDVCRWEFEGITKRSEELGYRIEEFALPEYKGDAEKLSEVIFNRGIRGVILGFTRERQKKNMIETERFAVAGLSAYFRKADVDRTNFHGLYNVRLALEEMRKLGYRRTGLVVPEFNNRISGGQWTAGALDWQRALPISDRCAPFAPTVEDSEAAFRRWMEQEQPDSLLVYKLPVSTWLSKLGLRAPIDIGIAYLFRTQEEMDSAAGIDGNLQQVGAAAVDLVVGSMNTNQAGLPSTPKEVLIKGTWRHGKTLKPKV
ncbi:LacI family DNA-binding transcriptional regulator [Pelagicoccus sp. SDUM812003]|uniref:LacI family DNA-binding transcriptional regulator n=1 Tax=Pelagicoccus sp. SDUM812003 TaxID=3041267 RepID=UPI00280D8D91|nr:LacI family DNA-binding transcriptional regulator [Pelagicoccus sp. SDUM812003]MDQ8202177.1 LacI family DNA-binding transcriptional regulator [Pelagicoccus sp. SDUM812003]